MKTFYSVKHMNLGACKPTTYWFDNLEEAKEFSYKDFSDDVVVHNIRNTSKINEIQLRIEQQKQGF